MCAAVIESQTGVGRRVRGRPSSREAMLDAAQQLALKEGAASLTLDAVARQAGVSKGGLMYNFPTKQALLQAMVERIIEHNRRAHAASTERLPRNAGRSMRAYIANSTQAPDTDDRVSGALLAALISDSSLRKPAADYFAQRFASISNDLPFEQAALVHLATEGLWMLELLQMSPFSERQRTRIVRELMKQSRALADT